ncbi:MAG: hypothetical protein Q4B03_02850 [Lachnospiraceae bacterium]|nr:hypothetical protein [Lachnospiraceae bacterium]
MKESVDSKKNKKKRRVSLSRGSMTVEAAFLAPMAVLLTVLLVFFCFCEHARVWYTAGACEASLVGTARQAGDNKNPERLAEVRAQQRIEEQPFLMDLPTIDISAEGKSVTVSYQSTGSAGYAAVFPYEVKETVKQSDPVGGVRTAWLARQIINGGE